MLYMRVDGVQEGECRIYRIKEAPMQAMTVPTMIPRAKYTEEAAPVLAGGAAAAPVGLPEAESPV